MLICFPEWVLSGHRVRDFFRYFLSLEVKSERIMGVEASGWEFVWVPGALSGLLVSFTPEGRQPAYQQIQSHSAFIMTSLVETQATPG